MLRFFLPLWSLLLHLVVVVWGFLFVCVLFFFSFHLFSPSRTKVSLMKEGFYLCWILLCKMRKNRTFWKRRLSPETHSWQGVVWSTQVLTIRCHKRENDAPEVGEGVDQTLYFSKCQFLWLCYTHSSYGSVHCYNAYISNAYNKPDFFFLKDESNKSFLYTYIFFYIFIIKTSKHHRNKEHNELPCTVTQLQKHQHLPFFEGINLIIFASNELCKMSHCGCSLQVHIFSLESDDARSMCCAL